MTLRPSTALQLSLTEKQMVIYSSWGLNPSKFNFIHKYKSTVCQIVLLEKNCCVAPPVVLQL